MAVRSSRSSRRQLILNLLICALSMYVHWKYRNMDYFECYDATVSDFIARSATPLKIEASRNGVIGESLLSLTTAISPITMNSLRRPSACICLLIFSCGDVHPCPGPANRMPCGKCTKVIRKNQRAVSCINCDSAFHCNCVHVDRTQWQRMRATPSDWHCDTCLLHVLPSLSDSFFPPQSPDTTLNSSVGAAQNDVPSSPRRQASIVNLKGSKSLKAPRR